MTVSLQTLTQFLIITFINNNSLFNVNNKIKWDNFRTGVYLFMHAVSSRILL